MSLTPYLFDGSPIDIIFIAIIPFIIFIFAIWFLFYIFEAIGLYKMSKSRGYKNAWISFIPLMNGFVLGGIVDNINIYYSKKTNWRKWMLIARIFSGLSSIAVASLVIVKFPDILFAIKSGVYNDNSFSIINIFAPIFAFSSLTGLISIACSVMQYICLYRIFQDYSPNNEVLFLVLSIFLGIHPFFLFALRNKPSQSISYGYRFNSPQANYAPPKPPMN